MKPMRQAAMAALLVLGVAMPAQSQPAAWAAHCKSGAADDAALLRASPDRLRRAAPPLALQRACMRLQRKDTGFDAVLELGQALNAASRAGDAASLLASLQPPASDRLAGARLAVALAENAVSLGRRAEAAEHAERALALTDAKDPAQLETHVAALLHRASAARAMRRPGGLERAEQSLAQAESLLQRAGQKRSHLMADLYNQRTMLANATWQLQPTMDYARRERDLVRLLDGQDAPGQIDALVTMGVTASMLRRYDESLLHLREARRIGRASPSASVGGFVGALNSLVSTLIDLDHLDEALQVADEAVAHALRHWGEGSPNTLTPLERRVEALIPLQRYAEAAEALSRMLAVLQRHAGQLPMDRRLRVLDRAANFYQRVGEFDIADEYLRQSHLLAGDDPQQAYWRGRIARRAGMQAAARQRWAEAERHLGRAVELITPTYGAPHPYITGIVALQCEAQVHAADPVPAAAGAPACQRLSSQLTTLDAGPASERLQARLALAAHARSARQAGQALDHLLHAVAIGQSRQGRGQLWRALSELSSWQRQAGRHDHAVALAKLAVAHVEGVRAGLRQAPRVHAGYLHDKYRLYRKLADWLIEDSRIGEALQMQDLLKGQEARDRSALLPLEARVPAEAAPLQLMQPAERAWLRRTPQPAAPGPADDAALQRAIANEAVAMRGWNVALALPLESRREQRQATPAALPEGELRATLFHGPGHLNIVVETRAGRTAHRMPSDAEQLARQIGRLHAALEAREDVLPLLQNLHARLGLPLETAAARSGATRWLLRLDGDLRHLPFAALHDGRQHLVERYAITQQTLQGSAALRAARPQAQPAYVQAFGSTRGGEGLPELAAVADEVCAIVDGDVTGIAACPAGGSRDSAVRGQGFVDGAFTRQRLQQALAGGSAERRDLLHVGSHFLLRAGDVGASWLLLGDGSRLPLQDMLAWPLQSIELVTLAACRTGPGMGAELDGLSQLLIERGAGAVIASLWPVDDRSTSVLMRRLYRELRTSSDAAAALRDAQLQLLRGAGEAGWRHAFYWAGFFLTQRSP